MGRSWDCSAPVGKSFRPKPIFKESREPLLREESPLSRKDEWGLPHQYLHLRVNDNAFRLPGNFEPELAFGLADQNPAEKFIIREDWYRHHESLRHVRLFDGAFDDERIPIRFNLVIDRIPRYACPEHPLIEEPV